MRVNVVAHLAPPLALGEQHDQALDRRCERPDVGATGLREQGDQIRMAGEELELGGERGADAVEGAGAGRREANQRLLEFRRAPCEHGAEQSALRVEVVEHQLLVHPGAACNLVHPRAVKPATGELLAGRGDDT